MAYGPLSRERQLKMAAARVGRKFSPDRLVRHTEAMQRWRWGKECQARLRAVARPGADYAILRMKPGEVGRMMPRRWEKAKGPRTAA